MGLLDSITPGVGSVIGAGLGFLGGQMTNDRSADQAASNNAWSAQQYATRYQTQVKDLEAAGLNPMLAYSQSPGSAPTAQAVQFQNPMSSAADVMRSVASSAQSVSSAHQADAQVKHIEQSVENLKEEFKNIPLKGNEINALVAKLAEEKTLLMRKGLNEIDIGNNLRQIGSKLKSETNLLNNQVEVEASLNNIGRYSKELGPIAQLLLNVLRSK